MFKVVFSQCQIKNVDDVRRDFNYSSTDVSIFWETRFSQFESDNLYLMPDEEYTLFRNDAMLRHSENTQPFGGTAVYSRLDYYPGFPYCFNRNGVEIRMLRFMLSPRVTIVGVYRSPAVSITEMYSAFKEMMESLPYL